MEAYFFFRVLMTQVVTKDTAVHITDSILENRLLSETPKGTTKHFLIRCSSGGFDQEVHPYNVCSSLYEHSRHSISFIVITVIPLLAMKGAF